MEMLKRYWMYVVAVVFSFVSYEIVKAIDSPTVTYYYDLVQLVILPIVALVLFVIAQIGEWMIERKGKTGSEEK
jgi:surface polysaccharide O-acyltransferase-like enzyme